MACTSAVCLVCGVELLSEWGNEQTLVDPSRLSISTVL
jgi:hypothetical protein